MALDQTNYDPTGSGSKGANKTASYSSVDALATIAGAGYFNAIATTLSTGDVLNVYSSAATGGGNKLYPVTVAAGVVTLGTGLVITA